MWAPQRHLLTENSDVSLIVVMEADIEIIQNIVYLFACFLANWWGNLHLKDCQYVGLTYSDWHGLYAKAVYNSPEIKNSVIKPHFKMLALPQKWVDKAQMNMFSFESQARRALGSEQPMPDADF